MIAALVAAVTVDLATGSWRAWLDAPIGELPFELVIDGPTHATIVNGTERTDVPRTLRDGEELVLVFPHYDSRIRARIAADGRALDGEWSITKSGRVAALPFHARAGNAPRFTPIPASPSDAQHGSIAGRWRATFDREEATSVGIFAVDGARVTGTFATPTGDMGFLAGSFEGDRLRLSTFDGGHAFLYDALLGSDGVLHGTFASGDRWQEGFTARREDGAQLGDAYALAHWKPDVSLAQLSGVDATGQRVCLGELAFGARAIVLALGGTWCPNCHDEAEWLAGLEKELRPKGLRVAALCFEYGPSAQRDLEQIARMREKHHAEYPFLLVGRPDKELAAQAFPALDRVFAFPTLVFLHGDGRVDAVHSGFEGPATREGYERSTQEIRARIERLLAEPEGRSSLAERLTRVLWIDDRDRRQVDFHATSSGGLRFTSSPLYEGEQRVSSDASSSGETDPRGTFVRFDGTIWTLDARADALLDPSDVGHRLVAAPHRWCPSVDGRAVDDAAAIAAGLESKDSLVRRECCWSIGTRARGERSGARQAASSVPTDALAHLVALLDDPDALVRATACWACGEARAPAAEPRLIGNLAHGSADVRREAAHALVTIGTGAALEALDLAARDPDPLVAKAAIEATAAIRARK